MLWQCVTHRHTHPPTHTHREHTQNTHSWTGGCLQAIWFSLKRIRSLSVQWHHRRRGKWKADFILVIIILSLWVLTQIALMEEYMLRVVYSQCSRPPELPAQNPLTHQLGGACDQRRVTGRCKRPSSARWTAAAGGGDGHHATWTWTADRTGRRGRENNFSDDQTVMLCSMENRNLWQLCKAVPAVNEGLSERSWLKS